MSDSDTTGESLSSISRREVLATTAGAGIISLAGCQGNGDSGDDGNGGDDGDGGTTDSGGGVDEVFIGAMAPLSGPFSINGERHEVAWQMAVDHAQEQGDIDADVRLEIADTESDPGTASTHAQEYIQNGADIVGGNISSAVALAVSEIAARRDVLHLGGAGNIEISGERCQPNTFLFSDGAVQQTNAALGYALREGAGSSVYEISANFAWGQSIQNYNQNSLIPQYDAEYVGNAFTPFGTEDFSSELIEARDTDADIINVNQFGADQIAILNQLDEFGLMDGERVITVPSTTVAFAGAVGPEIFSYENLYAGIAYNWTLDTPANNEFVEEFRNRSGGAPPLAYTPAFYIATRTTLNAVSEVGSTNTEDLRPALRGREVFPQIWNRGERIRECDHRMTAATLTAQGIPPEEADVENAELFEIIDRPDELEQFMRTCEEASCTMDV
jgi:branched-chain amino acid transport system substrate-binding protein